MPRFNAANYVDVQERINRFWTEHPDGAIVTKLMSPPDDFTQCRYEAAVYKQKDDQRPSATGYAFELAGTSVSDGANFTSHEENGETSAIGRALANMGYAKTREDRPSRQEMEKVNRAATPAQQVAHTRAVEEEAKRRFQNSTDIDEQIAAGAVAVAARETRKVIEQRPVPPSQHAAGTPRPITDNQMKFLIGLAKDLGMVVVGPDGAEHHDEAAMNAAIREYVNDPDAALTKLSAARASDLIEEWKARPKVARR